MRTGWKDTREILNIKAQKEVMIIYTGFNSLGLKLAGPPSSAKAQAEPQGCFHVKSLTCFKPDKCVKMEADRFFREGMVCWQR